MSELRIDHFLVAAPDLKGGCEYVERLLGKMPEPSGVHPGGGTCNALLGLAEDCYVEVLAPDPGQDSTLPLSLFLSRLSGPSLMWWAARSTAISALNTRLQQLDVKSPGLEPGSRRLPDGTDIKWRMLEPCNSDLGAALPFFIEWNCMTMHPARSLQPVGRLTSFKIYHPKSAALRSILGNRFEIYSAAQASICAEITVDDRTISLRSSHDFGLGIGDV